MHAIVPEARVSLDPRLLGENIIILPLQIAADLAKAGLVVHTVTKARGIHNGQADPRAFLVELQLHGHGLDLDGRLAGRLGAIAAEVGRGVGVDVGEDALLAEGVDEGGAAGARGAADHQAELDALLDVLLAPQLGAGDAVHLDVRRGWIGGGWGAASRRGLVDVGGGEGTGGHTMLVHGTQRSAMVEMREIIAAESAERDASAECVVALVNGCPVRAIPPRTR